MSNHGAMNKYLAAVLSGLSYTVASLVVAQFLGARPGGRLGGVVAAGLIFGGVVAWLATLAHAGRRERLRLPAESLGSIAVGWAVALIADLIAGAALVALIVVLASRAAQAGM
jgi:hypothetical protein